MMYDTKQELRDSEQNDGSELRMTDALPPGFVLTRQAVAALREYLEERGLGDYRIFHCAHHELWDIDEHLIGLGETGRWLERGLADDGVEPLTLLSHDDNSARFCPGGFLHLVRHEAVLARWNWIDSSAPLQLWLCAVPTAEHYQVLKNALQERRRAGGQAVWQVIRDNPFRAERLPRQHPRDDDLLLSEEVRRRIEMDVVGFLSDDVAALYRGMGVPHRRGVLLHGPPGNGKTSTIRYIGAVLRHVPAMILRPAANVDSNNLENVLQYWRRHAPAILTLEDLDWLLTRVNVSTFLNLLDGVETTLGGGLLLIATTNHPDKLDPAINNRPGRFDVVIEVPSPDASLRLQFLQRKLAQSDSQLLDRLVDSTDGLSFAHLQEIVRLSGLLAIRAGRTSRCDQDLLEAVEMVRRAYDDAMRGFSFRPEVPFGLAGLRARSRPR